jgi:hypothetical protein
LIKEQLAQASPILLRDPILLRELLARFLDTLMSAEPREVCRAAYGQTSPGPVD